MSYLSEVLADTPLAYWRLDGPFGRTQDETANNRDTTESGSNFTNRSSLLISDAANGSCEFDNPTSTGLLTSTDAAFKFTGTSAFTVECWVNPIGVDANYRKIIGWSDDETAGTNAYNLWFRSGTGIIFNRRVAGSDTGAPFSPTPLLAVHHVVGVYDGTNVYVCVNGSANKSTPAASGSQGAYTGTLWIGGGQSGGGSLKAIADEVAIYSGALSDARINAHYQAGSSTPTWTSLPRKGMASLASA
jgi:hypothetical protein